MTWAQALDTFRSHGYLNVTGVKHDARGTWWAEGQQQFGGPKLLLKLEPDGTVSASPSRQN